MSYQFNLINVDTDSISVCKKDNTAFSEEERNNLLEELNSLFPEKIKWDDDGYYKCIIVLKAKNYVLQTQDGKIKYKGNSLKAVQKEQALKEFITDIINSVLEERYNYVEIYNKYVKESQNLASIERWCFKKSITERVLNSQRTNETKVMDALSGEEFQEGDKRFFYFKEDKSLGLRENFDGNYNKDQLLKKLHDTSKIFVNIIPKDNFLNYTLKRNKNLLEELLKN